MNIEDMSTDQIIQALDKRLQAFVFISYEPNSLEPMNVIIKTATKSNALELYAMCNVMRSAMEPRARQIFAHAFPQRF